MKMLAKFKIILTLIEFIGNDWIRFIIEKKCDKYAKKMERKSKQPDKWMNQYKCIAKSVWYKSKWFNSYIHVPCIWAYWNAACVLFNKKYTRVVFYSFVHLFK